MVKKINKPNETNDIISLPKKDGNIELALKNNSRNILSSFYYEDFSNVKNIKKFIKNIEGQIRRSKEYKEYICHLDRVIGLNRCSLFGNITDDDEVTLEFHHYPFTLYDIVEIVINDKVEKQKKFTSFDIISEVLELHRQNKVGLVKLSKTAHQMVHAGQIFIKLDSLFGRVNDFTNEYIESIPDEIIEKYNRILEINKMDFKNYALYIKESNPNLKITINEETQNLILEMKND